MMNKKGLQDAHCDNSRCTSKGYRILRNIGQMSKYFPRDEPIMCVGSGDGLEVEAWRLLGYDAVGLDISTSKVEVSRQHGIPSTDVPIEAVNEFDRPYNIYCAHTLEHCESIEGILCLFEKTAISTICIIIPIEKRGTRNPSHLSPFWSLDELRIKSDYFSEVLRVERYNDELEGAVVWKINM